MPNLQTTTEPHATVTEHTRTVTVIVTLVTENIVQTHVILVIPQIR